jgi:hypothetical protein
MMAQTATEKYAFVGSVGYQTVFQRIGFQAQGRYNLCPNLRIAPDITFYFPKNQVTGLDVNVNVHYTIPIHKLEFYPLAGIGLQTNFYANAHITNEEGKLAIVDGAGSNYVFIMGSGLSYPLSPRSFLNLENKFGIGNKHYFSVMLGYGYKF